MESGTTDTAAVLDPQPSAAASVGVRASGTFLVLALLGGLTKLVGFLREVVLAAEFGACRQMDAFVVAQTLPAAVQGVFDELLGASVLPLFAGWLLAAGERAAWARLNRLLRIFFVAGCGVAAAAAVLAVPVIRFLAPGLTPTGTRLAAYAFRILAPCIALVAVGTICAALLNYHHRYLWTALAALLGNLATLFCILLYARRLGVYSAAVGMTLGALLVVAFQWRGLPAAGRREPPVAQARPWLAEFSQLAKPLAVGLGLYSLIPVVERFLTSWLPEGNIALINYAFKVNWLAYMIFVVPLTVMAFPRLAAAAAAGDVRRFQQVLALALKGVLLVLLPAMIVLIVAGGAVVQLLYQRRSFTAMDTAGTAAILKIYVLGLPGAAATLILFYALYALKLPSGRVDAGAMGLAVAGGCGWLAVSLWGAEGIALTHAINFSLMAILLGWFLRRSLASDWWRPLGSFAVRALLAAAGTLPLTWLGALALARAWPGMSILAQVGRLALCGATTASCFVLLCWLLRLGEIRSLAKELRGYVVAMANSRGEVSR